MKLKDLFSESNYELNVVILRNGLTLGGCILLIPKLGFITSLAIGMIIYSLKQEL